MAEFHHSYPDNKRHKERRKGVINTTESYHNYLLKCQMTFRGQEEMIKQLRARIKQLEAPLTWRERITGQRNQPGDGER